MGEAVGGVLEPGEDFLRLQVEARQRLDDRTQLAHGDGRLEALARDAADDERGTGAGQGDGVEPAAAVPAGQQDVRGVDGRLLPFGLREQPPLDRRRDHVLALVPAGVVDAEGRPGGRRDRQGDVVLVEGLGRPAAVEADHSEDPAPQGEGHDDQGVRAGLRDGARPVRVGAEPRGVGAEPDEPGPQVRGGERVRRTDGKVAGRSVRPPPGAAPALPRVPDGVAPAAGGAAQGGSGPHRSHRWLGAAQDVVHHLHDGEVGEARRQGVGEGTAGGGDVERPADRVPHSSQRGFPGPGPFPLGDVEERDHQAEGGGVGAAGAAQAVEGGQELPVAGDPAQPAPHEVLAHRALTGQYPLHELLGSDRVVEPDSLGEASSHVLPGLRAFDERVGVYQAELRVEHDETDGGLGEQRREKRLVEAVSRRRGRLGSGRGLAVRHGSTHPPVPARRLPVPARPGPASPAAPDPATGGRQGCDGKGAGGSWA